MNRCPGLLFAFLFVVLSLSCSPLEIGNYRNSLPAKQGEILAHGEASRVPFHDRTKEVVGHAEWLIEKNEREGAVLDERWYTFKRAGRFQEAIFNASGILFYGGLESDVRRELQNRYSALVPLQDDEALGGIRLFLGAREDSRHDVILIGQNGREVALKAIIRLIYLAKFADTEIRRKYRDKLRSFNRSLKVFMSSRTARQEFVAFFNKHGIRSPDAVMIGFIGDTRSIMRREGIEDPETYADESLRVNWYPNANAKKVLLVSIDENRIFASRAGALIDALLTLAADKPPSITFLGSGGAIDEPELVGKIVNPTVVLNGDLFPPTQNNGVLAHIIRNRAVDETSIRTAHVSVENVIVETTQWAAQMIKNRVRTVDQELFHIIARVNASADARKAEVFAGILVTDNVSARADGKRDVTLEHAEQTIAGSAAVREEFLSKVLAKIGILKDDKARLPRQQQIAR